MMLIPKAETRTSFDEQDRRRVTICIGVLLRKGETTIGTPLSAPLRTGPNAPPNVKKASLPARRKGK